LGSHGGRVIQRPAQDEATLEGGEEVIGKGRNVDLEIGATSGDHGAEQVIGGCCGTDARHVAAMWGVPRSGTEPEGVVPSRRRANQRLWLNLVATHE
jgi:hypothetical protein